MRFCLLVRTTPSARFKSASVVVSSTIKNRLSGMLILIPLHSLGVKIVPLTKSLDSFPWDWRRLTFFYIAPKQKELQSCARTQIEDQYNLFSNAKSKTTWQCQVALRVLVVFFWRVLLGKYLVNTEFPKAVSLYYSSAPGPKMTSLIPLRYLKLSFTIDWITGGIIKENFSCLHGRTKPE